MFTWHACVHGIYFEVKKEFPTIHTERHLSKRWFYHCSHAKPIEKNEAINASNSFNKCLSSVQ